MKYEEVMPDVVILRSGVRCKIGKLPSEDEIYPERKYMREHPFIANGKIYAREIGGKIPIESIDVRLIKIRDVEMKKIYFPSDVYNIVKPIENLDREVVIVIYLTNKNKVKDIEFLSKGARTKSLIDVPLVLRDALLLNAFGIIIAHNHPSGDVEPSVEDIEIAKRLKEACAIVGLAFLDSIIFGGGKYISLKEKGLL